MKHLSFLSLLLLSVCVRVNAQWSTDPANPLAVCNAAGLQNTVHAFGDGSGGYFVFWLDQRVANTTRLYGQRYDSLGVAQWTPNGKLVALDTAKNVSEFDAIRTANGQVYVAFINTVSGSVWDSLYVERLNQNGDALWSSPSNPAGTDNGQIGLDMPRLLATANGVKLGYYIVFNGGGNNIYTNRLDSNGNTLLGFNGVAVPQASYGTFYLSQDGTENMFLYWAAGNGMGAHVYAQRIDTNGATLWPANVDLTAAPGVGYDFRGQYDGHNGLIMTWVQSGNDIAATRIDTAGNFMWTPSTLVVCNDPNGQDHSRLLVHGDAFYILWQDSRPPAANADVFFQKFDLNGQPLWTPNGVRASNVNTYIPYSQMVPAANGSLIYTIEPSGSTFLADRIQADSTIAWTQPVAVLTNNNLLPFYDDYQLLSSADSGAVMFWANADNVYGARIRPYGELFNAVVPTNAENGATIYPNPTDNYINVKLQGNEAIGRAQVFDMDGRLLIDNANATMRSLDVRKLAAGLYLVRVRTDGGAVFGKFVKR